MNSFYVCKTLMLTVLKIEMTLIDDIHDIQIPNPTSDYNRSSLSLPLKNSTDSWLFIRMSLIGIYQNSWLKFLPQFTQRSLLRLTLLCKPVLLSKRKKMHCKCSEKNCREKLFIYIVKLESMKYFSRRMSSRLTLKWINHVLYAPIVNLYHLVRSICNKYAMCFSRFTRHGKYLEDVLVFWLSWLLGYNSRVCSSFCSSYKLQ